MQVMCVRDCFKMSYSRDEELEGVMQVEEMVPEFRWSSRQPTDVLYDGIELVLEQRVAEPALVEERCHLTQLHLLRVDASVRVDCMDRRRPEMVDMPMQELLHRELVRMPQSQNEAEIFSH